MSAVIGFAPNLKEHPALPTDAFSYAWLEGMQEAKIAFLMDIPDWQDIGVWPSGRIFGPNGEYRWQSNQNEPLHAVLILENGTLPAEFQGILNLEVHGEDLACILRGEWVNPDSDKESNPDRGPVYYSPEIPTPQTYPLLPNEAIGFEGEPRLITRRYRHMKHGEFLRCVSVALMAENNGG